MAMNFLEAAVFVTEVTSLAVGAELLPVELPAVLRFVLVVLTLLLLVKVKNVVLTQLIKTVRKLAFGSVATNSRFAPILANLSLVHRSLHKAFLLVQSKLRLFLESSIRLRGTNEWRDWEHGSLDGCLRHET